MRRKEREVKDINEIKEILNKSFALHLGLNDNGHIYVVPVNFGYCEKDGKFVFYFHGAKDGRKYNLIKNGCTAGFEVDCDGQIKAGEKACDYSAYYSSIIGEGNIINIEDNEEKKLGLNLIMEKATGKKDWNYPEIMLNRTGIFKLIVTELSCKAHKF